MKKSSLSLLILIFLSLVTIGYRIYYPSFQDKPLKVTNWDALGYYYFLPGTIIHQDVKKLDWLVEADQKYDLTGGDLYQFREAENGNKVGKYFCGIAFMQSPFFLIGHGIALASDCEADGFSAPYQYAIAWGVIFYFILALFILRRILLRYYDELTVGISLIILILGTNLLEYTAVEGALSHSYIFFLYVLLIHFTIKWHEKPKAVLAAIIGLVIGLAVFCRPTEAIMIFIPLFWQTQNKEVRQEKWDLVKSHKTHLIWAAVLGMIAISPQLLYWKHVSGSFVFNVGSKWVFFKPWFRVLVGIEKGWFVYTPLTLFFIIGFFFMKKYEFQRSVIIYGILNIWIVIAWFDWQYGGTYSTRALVQSYPVLCLGLAAVVERIVKIKWRLFLAIPVLYFIALNLFQIWQYNEGILHYRDMNLKYYQAIYWNPSPTPLQMSLLDTKDYIKNEEDYTVTQLVHQEKGHYIAKKDSAAILFSIQSERSNADQWYKIAVDLHSTWGHHNSYLQGACITDDTTKFVKIRMNNAISKPGEWNSYAFYFQPSDAEKYQFTVSIGTEFFYEGDLRNLKIEKLILSEN